MSAKEMFKKLDYDCDVSCDGILYYKWVEEYRNNDKYNDLVDYLIHIEFEKDNDGNCRNFRKTKCEGLFGKEKPDYITLEELQAINKQIEELEWNE